MKELHLLNALKTCVGVMENLPTLNGFYGLAVLENAKAVIADNPATPIPMVLHCPTCHAQHIDKPDDNPCGQGCRYAIDCGMYPEHSCGDKCMYMEPGSPRWTNPPHRTHQCQSCKHEWRPCNLETEGVEKL